MAKEGEHYYDEIHSEWSEILDVEYFQFFWDLITLKELDGYACMWMMISSKELSKSNQFYLQADCKALNVDDILPFINQPLKTLR